MKDIIIQNLLSPVVLFFVLGILAAILKSDLKFPSGLSESLSIYLLVAIGIKGGIELSHFSVASLTKPILGALYLGTAIPIIVMICLKFFKMDLDNKVGLAATYGSVSIVTFGAGITFLEQSNIGYEGFMNAVVVLMESPAILVSLYLLKRAEAKQDTNLAAIMPKTWINKQLLRESLFGKSVLLLFGSLVIGWIIGEGGLPHVKPLFIDLYSSVLILFLLGMGLSAGQRLPLLKKYGWKLLFFGIYIPILCGSIGVLVGSYIELSLGGTTLMGVLAGSASYIAAPAALRTSVPKADPSIYIGLALGVTFPFNLILGIPFYFAVAQLLQ